MTRPFTSALGTREALAVSHAGLVPLRQVMGVSYFKMGWQTMPWSAGGGWSLRGAGGTTELETQTEAWNEARRLAVGRLRDEAVACGADAVVGVRIVRAAARLGERPGGVRRDRDRGALDARTTSATTRRCCARCRARTSRS